MMVSLWVSSSKSFTIKGKKISTVRCDLPELSENYLQFQIRNSSPKVTWGQKGWSRLWNRCFENFPKQKQCQVCLHIKTKLMSTIIFWSAAYYSGTLFTLATKSSTLNVRSTHKGKQWGGTQPITFSLIKAWRNIDILFHIFSSHRY